MARFRLRFLLQEFDLAGPEIILGRSPDCHITIEDPLISRRHARIHVDGTQARVEDLGSRNGVRVNGRQIDGTQVLKDADRIRLGTQELVFLVVGGSERTRQARPTGYMKVCQSCGTPYPEQAQRCPHCGATDVQDEDTISGLLVEPRRNWTFQLLGEVIEKALATGRAVEADRVLSRASKEVDQRVASGERIDPAHVAAITSYAIRLAQLLGSVEWVTWALEVHRQAAQIPATSVVDRLEDLCSSLPDTRGEIGTFVTWWKDERGEVPAPDAARLARLEQLASA